MKRLVREPLLHFLLIGAAIFTAHHFVYGPANEEPGRIVITQREIEAMAISFSRTWQRQPTKKELEGLIRDRVQEEVYYREALAMGLDRDDTIVRRRLRQKLEFISDDVTALAEPTDADLADYLKSHPDVFRVEQRLTFNHIYLNPDKHGERLAQDAAELLIQLQQKGSDADPSSFGDPFLLEHRLEASPTSETAKQFGQKFATSLAGIAMGQWRGPVESGYGVHLVYVEQRSDGRVPELAEVRDAVQREWTNTRRLEASERFFQGLLKRYHVMIEQPQIATATAQTQR